MTKLSPIPDSILRKHDRAFFIPIRSALDLIIQGGWPVFPRRTNSFFAHRVSLTPKDISDLSIIRDLFVGSKLLTATAEQIRSVVTKGVPTSSTLSDHVYDLLSELFNYSEFQKGRILVIQNQHFYWKTPGKTDNLWGGYEYLQYHTETLKYCPYCNADSVYAFQKGDKTKVASALDHFFPKSKYPFLALSLYNLIPVCSRCNAQMKGAADMKDVANPFIEDIHRNVVFFPLIDNTSPSLTGQSRIAILHRKGCDPKVIEFVHRFELESLYSSAFLKDALLCMDRVRCFTPEFKMDLACRIRQHDPRLIDALLFGMSLDESDINKTHLGKMTLDIVEQFRI